MDTDSRIHDYFRQGLIYSNDFFSSIIFFSISLSPLPSLFRSTSISFPLLSTSTRSSSPSERYHRIFHRSSASFSHVAFHCVIKRSVGREKGVKINCFRSSMFFDDYISFFVVLLFYMEQGVNVLQRNSTKIHRNRSVVIRVANIQRIYDEVDQPVVN